MDPAVILRLIIDLYQQTLILQQENAQLRATLEQQQQQPDPATR